MALSEKEIAGLMRLVGLTKDEEINCEQCLALVAEFAEQELGEDQSPRASKPWNTIWMCAQSAARSMKRCRKH